MVDSVVCFVKYLDKEDYLSYLIDLDGGSTLGNRREAYKACLREVDKENEFEILKSDIQDRFTNLRWHEGYSRNDVYDFIVDK